jgi:hypothetical protein
MLGPMTMTMCAQKIFQTFYPTIPDYKVSVLFPSIVVVEGLKPFLIFSWSRCHRSRGRQRLNLSSLAAGDATDGCDETCIDSFQTKNFA